MDSLAKAARVSRASIYNYENGDSAPLPDALARVCAQLRVTVRVDGYQIRVEPTDEPQVAPEARCALTQQLVLDFSDRKSVQREVLILGPNHESIRLRAEFKPLS